MITEIILGGVGALILGLFAWGKIQSRRADKAVHDRFEASWQAEQANYRIKERTKLDHESDAMHERQRRERVEQYKKYEAYKSLREDFGTDIDPGSLHDGTASSLHSDSATDS